MANKVGRKGLRMKYSTMVLITGLIGLTILGTVAGCDNPYFNPRVSQAVNNERQAKALERIATALEKLKNQGGCHDSK